MSLQESVAQLHWQVQNYKLKNYSNMTREIITSKMLSCTPRELQYAIDIIHGWAEDFGDEMAGRTIKQSDTAAEYKCITIKITVK